MTMNDNDRLTQKLALREIVAERDRQDRKWGGAEHDDEHLEHDWIAFIVRHLGRAVVWPRDLSAFRGAMVKVGALAVAAVEWCDRHHFFAEEPGPVPGYMSGDDERSEGMKPERMCVNGCGEPVHSPSKVLCKKCFDELGEKIMAIGQRFEKCAEAIQNSSADGDSERSEG